MPLPPLGVAGGIMCTSFLRAINTIKKINRTTALMKKKCYKAGVKGEVEIDGGSGEDEAGKLT